MCDGCRYLGEGRYCDCACNAQMRTLGFAAQSIRTRRFFLDLNFISSCNHCRHRVYKPLEPDAGLKKWRAQGIVTLAGGSIFILFAMAMLYWSIPDLALSLGFLLVGTGLVAAFPFYRWAAAIGGLAFFLLAAITIFLSPPMLLFFAIFLLLGLGTVAAGVDGLLFGHKDGEEGSVLFG